MKTWNKKKEIADLKTLRIKEDNLSTFNFIPRSYASAVVNSNKVLVVKPKGEEKDVKKIKEDLRLKVNPTEMGLVYRWVTPLNMED